MGQICENKMYKRKVTPVICYCLVPSKSNQLVDLKDSLLKKICSLCISYLRYDGKRVKFSNESNQITEQPHNSLHGTTDYWVQI